MGRLRIGVTLLTLLGSSAALAQGTPEDPYAPDPVLSEQIAEQLVTRAQDLLDARLYLDAKQLAVEALVQSPKGPSADRARFIIKTVNTHLNIQEDPPPTPPSEVPPVAVPPQPESQTPVTEQPHIVDSEPPGGDPYIAAMTHGILFGGVLGATAGAAIDSDRPGSVIVPMAAGTGVGVGLVARFLTDKYDWDAAQVRTVGSFNVWGGVLGGLFADAVTGAGDGDATATGVLGGASLGATGGALIGGLVAHEHRLTTGQVALIDTLAGIGAAGGLTIGMVMQPAQNEAYAVNAFLGVAGGVTVGMIAGPKLNPSPRRMLRVAGLAAAGGALPFLLYAAIHDSGSTSDERLTGVLSTAGLLGGAYLGVRLTRGMDDSTDAAPVTAPPVALSTGLGERKLVFPLVSGGF
jgi:hypothetical protein